MWVAVGSPTGEKQIVPADLWVGLRPKFFLGWVSVPQAPPPATSNAGTLVRLLSGPSSHRADLQPPLGCHPDSRPLPTRVRRRVWKPFFRVAARYRGRLDSVKEKGMLHCGEQGSTRYPAPLGHRPSVESAAVAATS